MTALNGPILFNSSTGNDSTASGLGPSVAVIGSSAELDGTSTVDVSFDMASLSGISSGDLLFCDTTSGRKFSVIASVDTLSGTITTDDSWGTESGVSWAVGGKRATFDNADSRQSFADAKGNWDFQTETNQTISSTLVFEASGIISGSSKYKEIINTSSSPSMKLKYPSGYIQNFHFKCTNATKGAAFVDGSGGYGGGTCLDCKLGDDTDTISSVSQSVNGGGGSPALVNCIVYNTTGTGFNSDVNCVAINTLIQDCGGYGVRPQNNADAYLDNCIITGCASGGVFINSGNGAGSLECRNTIIYGNLGSGIQLNINGRPSRIFNTVISSNSGYGIYGNIYAESKIYQPFNFNICFHNNSLGETYLFDVARDSITLTADPFTDAANGDFSLNSDAGGGAVLRAETMVMGSTTTYPFNRLTDGSGGGGSGSAVHPLYAN